MTTEWWCSGRYAGWIENGTLYLLRESQVRLARENLKRIKTRG